MKSGKHSYIGTVEALRSRCRVDPQPGGCWHWLGATSSDGLPRIHTFDHQRGEKVSQTGGRGAFNIAFGKAPAPGMMVMRCCGTRDCVNPVHLREMRSQREMGQHIRRAGWRVGTHLEQRRANQALAMKAAGVQKTPDWQAQIIWGAPPETTNRELARRLDMRESTVSAVRRRRDRCATQPPNVSAQAPMSGVA